MLPAAAAAFFLSAPTGAGPLVHPLNFFEGRTESSGTVKLFMRNPYRTRSIGRGHIESDGSLTLVQQVQDEGKPPRERLWRIRQIGSGHFAGTMSEASGPVTIDRVGDRYRFRFKMKGHLSVEQWLAPLAGGMTARNSMTVRKFGMTVGTGDGTVRKF
ncbi:MAG: DUF3833 family protein [Sphingomicrobium sp.]